MMSDASNKGDPVDSKRAYGFCTIWMGGPVIASAKKLDHSSSATAANEYMAISNATKYGIWLRQLLTEMDLKELVVDPTIVFADNNSANQWCRDDKVTQGNMWILQSYHFVKEMTDPKVNAIDVKYVNTKYNLADLFTKGVSKEVLEQLSPYLIGQQPIKSLLKLIQDQGGQSQ